jgi:hypothetical protein
MDPKFWAKFWLAEGNANDAFSVEKSGKKAHEGRK